MQLTFMRWIRLFAVLALAVGSVLTWAPGTAAPASEPQAASGVLSVPAAAFLPAVSGYQYQNHGRFLIHSGSSAGVYQAAVLLPQGATVTRVKVYYRKNSSEAMSVTLKRQNSVLTTIEMAKLVLDPVSASPYYDSKTTSSVKEAIIDHTLYSYFLVLDLPLSTNSVFNWLDGVVIDYQTPDQPPANSYLNLPAAGLTPFENGYTYDNQAGLMHVSGGPGVCSETGFGCYMMPVHLPDGAWAHQLTVYYKYGTEKDVRMAGVYFQRKPVNSTDYMALRMVWTVPTVMYGSQSSNWSGDTSLLIDNMNYTYWVIIDLPPSIGINSIQVISIQIAYSSPSSGTAARLRNVSVPMAAFTPFENGMTFQNHGRFLLHQAGGSGACTASGRGCYLAPLYLPDGVRIRAVWFFWYDFSLENVGKVILQRTTLYSSDPSDRGNYYNLVDLSMKTMGDNPAPPQGVSGSGTLDIPIDNRRNAYWLVLDLPASTGSDHPGIGDVTGLAVLVQYQEPKVYLPGVYLRDH